MRASNMHVIALLTLVLAAGAASATKTCAVYDATGNALGEDPRFMGAVSKDAEPGTFLPGELRFENARPGRLKRGTCTSDVISTDVSSGVLRFAVAGDLSKLVTAPESSVECVFFVEVVKDEDCPESTPSAVHVTYLINDYNVHAPAFSADAYTFQRTFPVPRGTKLNDVDIAVTDPDFATREIRLRLQEAIDGVEIVRVSPATGKVATFELRATKMLYLQEDLNLTLIASFEPGESSSKARLKLQMNEDSGIPRPEFEKSFYDVTLHASDLNFSRDVFPTGVIKLSDDYIRLDLDLRPLNRHDLRFEVVHAEGSRSVGVRLLEEPVTNLTSQDVLLQLTARLTNAFGRQSEGFTSLLIRVEANATCDVGPVIFNSDDKEHLTIAVIVLSVVVVLLLFIIIFGYFKYVCVRKPVQRATPHKEPSAPPVKTRRPTPRKISEYPYPLDKLPAPLETLAEEDGEGKQPETRDEPAPSTSGVKTRKRSMTFRESDEESRQNRESLEVEAVVHRENERKPSTESQRKLSAEESRRRKSSLKMYRCVIQG